MGHERNLPWKYRKGNLRIQSRNWKREKKGIYRNFSNAGQNCRQSETENYHQSLSHNARFVRVAIRHSNGLLWSLNNQDQRIRCIPVFGMPIPKGLGKQIWRKSQIRSGQVLQRTWSSHEEKFEGKNKKKINEISWTVSTGTLKGVRSRSLLPTYSKRNLCLFQTWKITFKQSRNQTFWKCLPHHLDLWFWQRYCWNHSKKSLQVQKHRWLSNWNGIRY